MAYFAHEYGFTPDQTWSLKLIPMCILLGAVTPDHHIVRLPPRDYFRFVGSDRNRENLKRYHKR